MASINNGLFQDAKGSLGNTYVRQQNGKTVVCSKPSKYRASMEERPVAVRNMMQVLTKTSSNLMQDQFFYDLWKIKEIKGLGPYHKFLSKNHFRQNKTQSLHELKLSPYDDSFPVEIENFSITKGKVDVTLKPLGEASGINTFREPLILSRGILIATGNKNVKHEAFDFSNLETKPIQVDLVNPITLNMKYLNPQTVWDNYKNVTVLLILATLNSQEQLSRTSITLSGTVQPEG